jgi:hypothetical protein
MPLVIMIIMSDREPLNQALLLHLWWPHSEVGLTPGDKGGDFCALYKELRAFRGARVTFRASRCQSKNHTKLLVGPVD